MKLLDVEPLVMLDVYLKEIRSILELAVPAWHSGLTQKQSADIERVQRVAVKSYLVINLDLVTSAMTRPLLYWNWNHFLSEEKDSVSTLQGKPLDQDIRICSTP